MADDSIHHLSRVLFHGCTTSKICCPPSRSPQPKKNQLRYRVLVVAARGMEHLCFHTKGKIHALLFHRHSSWCSRLDSEKNGWSFCRVSFVGDQFWPILLKWIDLTIKRYPIDILFTTWNERNQKPSLGWFPLCLSSSMNLWSVWPARKIGGSYRSKHLNPSLPLGDPGYVPNCGF